MWGVIRRILFYPFALLIIILAYIGAGLGAARIIEFVPAIGFAAFVGAFAAGSLAVRMILGKASRAFNLAGAFPLIAAGALAISVWLFARGYPTAPIDDWKQPASNSTWTLQDGATISYERCGDPDGAPLVFLHGGPAIPPRGASIDTVCAIGDEGYDVYIYDQIGSGGSSRLANISAYSVGRHVADLEEIRAQIGADTINLVGVSWGSVLASHFIAAHPGRVSSAVFVSPGILGPRKGDDVEYDYSLSASSDYDGVLLPPLRVIIAGLMARMNPGAAVNYMPQAEAGAVMDRLAADPGLEYQGKCKGASINAGSGERGSGANYYANLMTAQDLKRLPDPTGAIRAASPPPILIMRGVCDYIPRSALGRYEAAFPAVTIIDVDQEGHSFLGARPDIIVPAAKCFLSQSCE